MGNLPQGWTGEQSTPTGALPQGWSSVPIVSGKAATSGEQAIIDGYGAADVITSGMSLGFSDEIAAGANALVEGGKAIFTDKDVLDAIPEGYSRTKDVINFARDKYQNENPIAGPAMEIGGGLLTGGAAVKGAGTILGGLKAGAKSGAVGGIGFADGGGVADRAQGGAIGAAGGAVAGGAISAALKAGGAVGRVLGNIVGAGDPEKKAVAKIGQALQRDGALEGQIAGKPDMLMDIAGDSTRRLAGAARSTPSTGASNMASRLEGRVATQGDRLADDLATFLGKSGDDFASTLDDIATRKSAQAGPLYEALQKTSTKLDGRLLSLLERPALRGALSSARETLENSGTKLADDAREVPFALLDQAKKALDAKIRFGRTPQGGAEVGDVHALKALRAAFVKELDDRFPGYAKARRIFSDETALEDAMLEGRKFFKGDAEITGKSFKALPEAEQDAFRLGAAREIKRVIEETPDGADAANRLIRSKALRDRLRVIFGDESAFDGFVASARRESQFARSRNEVLKGSQTEPRIGATDDLAQDALEGGATGGTAGAVSRVLGRLVARGRGMDKPTQSQIAEMLSSDDIQGVLAKVAGARGVQIKGPSAGGAAGAGQANIVSNLMGTEGNKRVADMRGTAAPPANVKARNPMDLARQFTGMNEKKDARTLSRFINTMTGGNLDPAKTAWCAAFVNAVLTASGSEGTGKLNARSFLKFGTEAKSPTTGDVVVLWREDPTSWKGHVGFYAGTTVKNGQKFVRVLGGNQDDEVNEKLYPIGRVLSYRRPPRLKT